jgi:hypothetical protein
MLTETLPRTVIGAFTVSTVTVSDVWETIVFYPEGDRFVSTDPCQHPRHPRDTMINGFNAQIARIAHDIVCERLSAGQSPWDATNVSKDDIKAVIRSRQTNR